MPPPRGGAPQYPSPSPAYSAPPAATPAAAAPAAAPVAAAAPADPNAPPGSTPQILILQADGTYRAAQVRAGMPVHERMRVCKCVIVGGTAHTGP